VDIFELRYPGSFLDGISDEGEDSVNNLICRLESNLADASIGLSWFNEAWAKHPIERRWKQRAARSSEIRRAMERELPGDPGPGQRFKQWVAIQEAADLQARREEWAAGIMPENYEYRLAFIHAHTVLYALDAIGKTLKVLAKMGLPTGLADAYDAYKAALPTLVDVRDSAHHTEDRARRVHHGNQPLVLQPITTGPVNAPGGVLMLSALNGNRLGYTAADGNYLEVEISAASVAAAQSAIQQVLDALSWSGRAYTAPEM